MRPRIGAGKQISGRGVGDKSTTPPRKSCAALTIFDPPSRGGSRSVARRNPKTNSVAALFEQGAPPKRTLQGSPCHRSPASRLVPSGRPRASARASVRASPGSGSPVPAFAGEFFRTGPRAFRKEKPSGAPGLGRVRNHANGRYRSGGISPVSRAGAFEWPWGHYLAQHAFCTSHCTTRRLVADTMSPKGGANTPAIGHCQPDLRAKNATDAI